MNKLLMVLLIVSIIGNVIGLFFAYKYRQLGYRMSSLQDSVIGSGRVVNDLTDRIESSYSKRMLFVHHSVGQGMLDQGGLRDSLLNMGIFVKGATYGDEIGHRTDICDWVPKFSTEMKKVLEFKNHPDLYYKDGRSNDIIMFKSCYPCSYVESEGSGTGDPVGRERTLANYRAAFEEISRELRRYPDKLFIYLTYPPLVPIETNPEAAKRARDFNAWLKDDLLPRYEKETGLQNFYVFDLFDVLADDKNVLRAEFRQPDERDSHPNSLGSKLATEKFLAFFHPVWSSWQSRTADATTTVSR